MPLCYRSVVKGYIVARNENPDQEISEHTQVCALDCPVRGLELLSEGVESFDVFSHDFLCLLRLGEVLVEGSDIASVGKPDELVDVFRFELRTEEEVIAVLSVRGNLSEHRQRRVRSKELVFQIDLRILLEKS